MRVMRFFFVFLGWGLSVLSCSQQEVEMDVDKGGITGLWKTRDQYSEKPRGLVVIYEYQGRYYGRMLATYDENEKIQDSIVDPKDKAPGVIGNPPYCGMDFIYNVQPTRKGRDEGKILDPLHGKVYDVELWRRGINLVVRGKIWIFGKNIIWSRASISDLPSGFSMSEVSDFVPVIPQSS